MNMRRGMAWAWLLLATAAMGPVWAIDEINVSKIATGTHTAIDWASADAQPKVAAGTLSYFTLTTAAVQADAQPFVAPPPWNAALQAAPAYPDLLRKTPLADYSQGGADFHYARDYSSLAEADMKTAKQVRAAAFRDGSGSAAASYRVQIDNTTGQALDYFVDLAVPVFTRSAEPGYDLCCSGDSNGGTYTYHRPKNAHARAAVDLYADELPLWSSESTFLYPNDGQTGSPFDKLEWQWDRAPGTGSARLYLGRLAAGGALTLTLVVRADAATLATDCGITGGGFYGGNQYDVRCYDVQQTIKLAGGTNGAPVAMSLFAKAPPAAAIKP